MSWGAYGILILFGLFVLLMILNPSLSCFGRVLRSPFYPLFRKKSPKKIKTEDYGFNLVETPRTKAPLGEKKEIKTEDYGFSLSEDKGKIPSPNQKRQPKD